MSYSQQTIKTLLEILQEKDKQIKILTDQVQDLKVKITRIEYSKHYNPIPDFM